MPAGGGHDGADGGRVSGGRVFRQHPVGLGAQGAQIAYDARVQRTRSQLQPLTNRTGDAGTLHHLHRQYRSHVYPSAIVRLTGRRSGKRLDHSGDAVVEIETRATNQRGQNVMPGTATVALPRRPRGRTT